MVGAVGSCPLILDRGARSRRGGGCVPGGDFATFTCFQLPATAFRGAAGVGEVGSNRFLRVCLSCSMCFSGIVKRFLRCFVYDCLSVFRVLLIFYRWCLGCCSPHSTLHSPHFLYSALHTPYSQLHTPHLEMRSNCLFVFFQGTKNQMDGRLVGFLFAGIVHDRFKLVLFRTSGRFFSLPGSNALFKRLSEKGRQHHLQRFLGFVFHFLV